MPTWRRFPPLTWPDDDRAALEVQVALGKRERLADSQPGAPKHDDQATSAEAVGAISGLAHDGDDLLDALRIGGVMPALVPRRPPNVIAGERGGRPTTTSGIQQLRRHDSSSTIGAPHPPDPTAQAHAPSGLGSASQAEARHSRRRAPGLDYDRSVNEPSPKDQRAASVAHILARAVRAGEICPTDALRILRHEMRRRNTNTTLKIETRSRAAQASIERYAPDSPPKNGSPDALHADHVFPLTTDLLHSIATVDDWLIELERLRTVVCVTAAENYALEKIERTGVTAPEKYAMAGVTFTKQLDW
jgi:hypothetical protein